MSAKTAPIFLLLLASAIAVRAQTTLSTLDYPDPHVGSSLTTSDYGFVSDWRVGTKQGDAYAEVIWINRMEKFVSLNGGAPVEIVNGSANLALWDNVPAAPVANGYFIPARFESWTYDAVNFPGVWHSVIEYENGGEHIIGGVGYKLLDPSPTLGSPYVELNPAYQFTNVGASDATLKTFHYERNAQVGNTVYSNHGGGQWDYDNADGTSDDFVAVSSAASPQPYLSFAGFPLAAYRIQDSAGNLLNQLQGAGANFDLVSSTNAVLGAAVEIAYQVSEITLAPGEAVLYWLYPKPIKVVNTATSYPSNIDYEKKAVSSTGVGYTFANTDVSIEYSGLNFKTNGAGVTATTANATVAEITGGIVASGVSGALNNVSTIRYWEIFYDTRRLSSTADITFTYDPATDAISDENSLTLAYRTDYSQDWTEWVGVVQDQGNNTLTAISVHLGDSQWILASTSSNNALPVELTTFSANRTGRDIRLFWTTASETDNYGFDVERSRDAISWVKIGFVHGHGSIATPKDYSFLDVEPGDGAFYYRLKQIDGNGGFEYSKAIGIEDLRPAQIMLKQNYPNPFNPTTVISFGLPEATFVSLKVFNLRGEEIAELAGSQFAAGWHSVPFDASGLPSGLYFYQIRAGRNVVFKKMLLRK